MISIRELTKGTAFRMAALSAALTTVLIVLLFAGLFFVFRIELRQGLQTHVEEVQATLSDVGRSEGRRALINLIGQRPLVENGDEEDIFLLTDKLGNWLAGNIRGLQRFEGWRFLPWKDLALTKPHGASGPTDAILGRWTSLPDAYLFVGDGNQQIRASERLLFKALLVGLAGTLSAALAAGAAVGWRIQQRIKTIDKVLNKVASGNFRLRIPVRNSNHDIDCVAQLINQMLDRLEALIGNLRNVSTDIAHDLRGPLNRLRHKVEIMRDSPNYTESGLDSMLAEIDSITAVFDALLRVSEIEAGERKRFFADLNLIEVVANVVDALEAVADENGQRLLTKLPADEVRVSGDRQLLSQLFMNLVENSIQHCPKGATINVSVRSAPGTALFEVIDNGPGICLEERQNVFKRFYRLDSYRGTPGSGLGLSLAAAIASLHGMKVDLQDAKPGVCARVVLVTPSSS